ncbi:glycosyltransferase family 4 protein [Coriobacteriia bacterium Es71-Z0120]|uniref:glycosyltransferase family 4 protein n=1 Tax=Parvivirga hydrogeniphila TaxID=2939460 RepID=UPI002260AC85|nr:glycosyltransferase family 4 protein [Parvivirga hydrogeniphila]MCL4078791.1 glycosyltransferase family 4 protein [Parvivirga hydrogeniphila]
MSVRGTIVMVASASVTADPRIIKEAEALVADGWEVVVLAWDRARRDPERIERDGWRIERVGPEAAHGGGPRNVAKYWRFWAEAAARCVALAPDVIHCHDLDTAIVAVRARRRLPRLRVVLDFHELYRESRALPQGGLPGVIARAAARLVERTAIPKADVVVTVTSAHVAYYERLGARRVVLVENAPDLDRYTVVDRREDDFVVSFIGQKRWITGLVKLMQAIQPHPHLKALLAGGGTAAEEIARIASTMERIEVLGRVEPDEIPGLYHRCDAVYACYDASLGNWRTTIPVKALEGMACGLPVIVTRGTWIGDFVEQHELGFAIDPLDVAEVEEVLLRLSSDRELAREMGRRGRAIIEGGLNWAAAARRLTDAYRGLAGEAGPGPDVVD